MKLKQVYIDIPTVQHKKILKYFNKPGRLQQTVNTNFHCTHLIKHGRIPGHLQHFRT